MRGRTKAKAVRGRGTRPAKPLLPPAQRSLLDYIRPFLPAPSDSTDISSSQPGPPPTPSEEEPAVDHRRLAEREIADLVAAHQLNAVVDLFRMRDRLRFSDREIRRLYDEAQAAIEDEFGAPLSPSLFPPDVAGASAPGSDGSCDPHSSQRPDYHF
jgi:hypothetical protein